MQKEKLFRQIFCTVIVAFLVIPSISFGEEADKVAKSEAIKTSKEISAEDIQIPKSVETLRQMQLDTGRKIEAAELGIRQMEIAASLIDEIQSQNTRSKFDPSSVIARLEGMLKSKDFNSSRSTIERLYFEFLSSNSGYNSLKGSAQDLAPGTLGRRIYNQTQSRLSETYTRYAKPLQDALPAGALFTYSNPGEKPPPPLVLTERDLLKIREAFTTAIRNQLDADIQRIIANSVAEVAAEISRQKEQLAKLVQIRDRLTEAADKAKKEINELAITLGLPLFCGTVVILFIIPFIAQRYFLLDKDGAKLPGSFQFSTLVEISTVLLLTMSILILGLAGKLEPAVLGTLLGGISGYVLNRTSGSGKTIAAPDGRTQA